MMIRLAAYGTLMTGQHNALPAAVRQRMRSLGPCRIPGRVLRVPGPFAFPALVPAPGRRVPGDLLIVPAAMLKAIDAYEHCRPASPAASMYLRRLQTVQTEAGRRRAWVYVWNRPLRGLVPIAGNRWA